MCILTCRGLLRVSVPACTCRQDARALSSRAWLLQCRLLRSLALVWEEDTSGTGEEAHASATVARAVDGYWSCWRSPSQDLVCPRWVVYILLVHGEGSRLHDGPTMV